jgi:hypothetical protein
MPTTDVLRVERGEKVILSPNSRRFTEDFERIRPHSAAEVRKIVGPSVEVAQALHELGARPQPSAGSSKSAAPEDLDSTDSVIRARAWTNIGNSLRDYVYATDTQFLAPMQPAFQAYLDLAEIVLHVATLPNIEVAHEGVLLVSEDTHVLNADSILIHGTGKIVCLGGTTINANTIVGTD